MIRKTEKVVEGQLAVLSLDDKRGLSYTLRHRKTGLVLLFGTLYRCDGWTFEKAWRFINIAYKAMLDYELAKAEATYVSFLREEELLSEPLPSYVYAN